MPAGQTATTDQPIFLSLSLSAVFLFVFIKKNIVFNSVAACDGCGGDGVANNNNNILIRAKITMIITTNARCHLHCQNVVVPAVVTAALTDRRANSLLRHHSAIPAYYVAGPIKRDGLRVAVAQTTVGKDARAMA